MVKREAILYAVIVNPHEDSLKMYHSCVNCKSNEYTNEKIYSVLSLICPSNIISHIYIICITSNHTNAVERLTSAELNFIKIYK